MSNSNAAGLIFDSSIHYLDHLAPFCAQLNWPLMVCDPTICELTARYYPDVKIIECSAIHLSNQISSLTHLVSCASRPLLQAAVGPVACTTLWLPHGHSDKGQIAPYFDALKDDQIALVYGQKMANVLKEHSIQAKIVRIGRFRHHYYQKRRDFYKTLPVQFSHDQRTVLYAPTWEDCENNCSFWNAFPLLAKGLPSDINLIVKPHPNTVEKHAPEIERLIGQYENGHLQFLLDYPPILPLLDQCDAYLGDRSSIGYDFLFFDRPMFFLDPHQHRKGRDLLDCGRVVTPENFYDCWLNQDHSCFSKIRKATFNAVFDDIPLKFALD
ncbi:MAG: hypothetical protein HW387_647 [Parachlamydiales bacterium]|nr:hypothetical protein [Parachlamydiales bacterium]